MASIPRDTDINPLSQIYDELKTVITGMVVKFSCEADKYETLETRQYVDGYIAALNKTDSFGFYEYTSEEFNNVGIFDTELITQYQKDQSVIPKNIREKLVLTRRESTIANFDEPNEYYRKLSGLPPKNVNGGRIVTSLINRSLEIVDDNDFELESDYTLQRISISSAYKIMGHNRLSIGDRVLIRAISIDSERKSNTRSFEIVSNDTDIRLHDKSVYLKDVQNIMYAINNESDIPEDEIIGLYLYVNVSNTMDTTSTYKNSLIVVNDDIENYDENEHIKLSEALLNNKQCKLDDRVILETFIFVDKEIEDTYGISIHVPIHKIRDYYGERYVNILESNGFLANIISENPDDEYLNYIGMKRVDSITARNAKNFDILFLPDCEREVIHWVFTVTYNSARDYMVNTVYNYYYRSVYDYYDNFIGLAIVQLAVSQTIARSMQTAIDRDFYDEVMVKLLFEMYNIPYYPALPYQTQRRLVKNLNYLIQNKATTRIILDIASILGYHDVNIYKYYLVKERKFDSDGNLVYKDTQITSPEVNPDTGEVVDKDIIVNDLENMYDVYFQKVDIDDTNFKVALTDSSKRVSYESLTSNDPLWWDDAETFEEVYGDNTKYTPETEPSSTIRSYNFRETKYLGMSIAYKMSEVLYENIMLSRMLIDKKKSTEDIYVTLPKITGSSNISLFDIIVFLCALISKQYNLRGEILTRYSSVMDVMGYITVDVDGYRPCDTLAFNFDLVTNADTYKEITKDPLKYLSEEEKIKFDQYFSVITLDQASVKDKITAINDMYQNIKGLGYFVGRKIAESSTIEEYRSWRDFYNALFIGHENAEMFKLGDTGDVAETYSEYLSVMNPQLFNALNQATHDTLYTYIDHTISRLEKVVSNLKSLYTVNDSNSSMLNYLIKLIRFFKSYTTDLIDVTTEYIFDMKPDNLFKLTDYYKIHMVNLNKDVLKLLYADTMKVIEKTQKIDPLKYEEWVSLSKENKMFDYFSINNITCSSCKNIENCDSFCKEDQETCNGEYRLNGEYHTCRFFNYDSTGMKNYIDKYRDLLLHIDCKNLYDVRCAIRTHLKVAYHAYSIIKDFNPVTDDFWFDPEHMKGRLSETLSDLNDILSMHEFSISISDTGVEGINEWIDVLTNKDASMSRKCVNENYPCREKTCGIHIPKEKAIFKDTLWHGDMLKYLEITKIQASMWLDEELTPILNDKIHKAIDTRKYDEEMVLTDYANAFKIIVFKDDKTCLHDVFNHIEDVKESNDSFSLRDEIIMYEEP